MNHPDPFYPATLHAAAKYLRDREWIFDPFAGTGRIHDLRNLIGIDTIGFEIEPEWAQLHQRTICADSTTLRDHWRPDTIPAILTAPTVGNRTNRHAKTQPNPTTRSNTYQARLGRDLHANNTGRYQYHQPEFQRLHNEIWRQCVEVLAPGGIFLLVTRDFIRNRTFIRTNDYHITTLDTLGLIHHETITIRREFYRSVGNRTGVEFLHLLTKPLTTRTPLDHSTIAPRSTETLDALNVELDPSPSRVSAGTREGTEVAVERPVVVGRGGDGVAPQSVRDET